MTFFYDSPLGTLAIDCCQDCDFDDICRWFDEYFSGRCPQWLPKITIEGTDFQLKVWKYLLQIPYGETVTYGELAEKISPSMSAQAVGRAVGMNPCCIIIPCHRVVGANGDLKGYAHGIEMKRWLLDFEQRTKIV